MRTLIEEITRIKSEVAEIASKTFFDKTIQQRVKEKFSEITPQEYEASEKVWSELCRRRRELREELNYINDQIEVIEEIIFNR